jgi:hypothetical protein
VGLAFCFLLIATNQSNAQAPAWQWAKSSGGGLDDTGNSVCVDEFGNSYITGVFQSSTMEFGNVELTNVGDLDVFIAKYDTNGNVLWAKSAGGSQVDASLNVGVDAAGDVYITGLFGPPSIAFGDVTLTNAGGSDIFVAKYSSTGNFLWARNSGGASDEQSLGMYVDEAGNAYVTGRFKSPSIAFGATTLTNVGGEDIFITKYDASGNVVWAKGVGGTSDDNGNSISVDLQGNSYVTGNFTSPTLTFGSTTLTNASTLKDFFIAKFNADGIIQWAVGAGGTAIDVGYKIDLDDNGNCYVIGNFSSPSITFGTYTFTNSGTGFDFFILKFDSQGSLIWAKKGGGNKQDALTGIKADNDENLILSGYFMSSTIVFDTHTLSNVSDQGTTADMFVLKFDESGNTLWALAEGGVSNDYAWDVNLDSNGNSYITGSFNSANLIFDEHQITNNSALRDVFVAKLDNLSVISEQNNSKRSINFYPNPTQGWLSIEINSTLKHNVQILDVYGRCFFSDVVENGTTISTTNWPAGIYLISDLTVKNVVAMKIIKE